MNPRHVMLLVVVLAAVVAVGFMAPIPQDPAYHIMADQRTMFGVPNGLNVLSNLPFLFFGIWGLIVLLRGGSTSFPDATERRALMVLFAGLTLTTFGSAWYHLAPNNARLVWDRLPMTLGFMGLLTALLAARVGTGVARALFGPLLLLGLGSVFYWYATEVQGRGDLRLYVLVQFGSIAVIVLLLALYPGRAVETRYLVAALGAYVLAKVFEGLDGQVFAYGHFVSGHTIKHLLAGVAGGCLAAMVAASWSRPIGSDDFRVAN